MNTKKRLICIGACGLGVIVLVAVVLLVQLLPKKGSGTDVTGNGDVTPTYARELDEIYTITDRQIASVGIKNASGDGNIKMRGAENVPLLSETASNLFKSVLVIYSESLIEDDCKDLSVYGLDEPAATLSVNSTRGFSDIFYIGDKTPDGGAYYFLKDGDTTVWCVNTYFAQRVLKARNEFFDLTISKPYELTDFLSLSIDFNDKSRNYEFRFCTQEEIDANLYADSMVMTSPFTFRKGARGGRKRRFAFRGGRCLREPDGGRPERSRIFVFVARRPHRFSGRCFSIDRQRRGEPVLRRFRHRKQENNALFDLYAGRQGGRASLSYV